jgi:hypothetical protein
LSNRKNDDTTFNTCFLNIIKYDNIIITKRLIVDKKLELSINHLQCVFDNKSINCINLLIVYKNFIKSLTYENIKLLSVQDYELFKLIIPHVNITKKISDILL